VVAAIALMLSMGGAAGQAAMASYATRPAVHYDPAAGAAVCGAVVIAIDRAAAGHSPLGNHGVWAELHFWPLWTGVYAW
jgi:hypothetical protein